MLATVWRACIHLGKHASGRTGPTRLLGELRPFVLFRASSTARWPRRALVAIQTCARATAHNRKPVSSSMISRPAHSPWSYCRQARTPPTNPRAARSPAFERSALTQSEVVIFPKRRSDWVALPETALNFPPGPNHGRPATLVSSTLSIGHRGEKGSFPLRIVGKVGTKV